MVAQPSRGNSPEPSATDEETFCRVFGGCQWAVMFVLARGGKSYARLRFNVGPGGQLAIPVEVDYRRPFAASDPQAWEAEYKANVRTVPWPSGGFAVVQADLGDCAAPDDWLEELEAMEPAERQAGLEELTARSELWGREVTDGY